MPPSSIPLRLANFGDSSLEALDRKGNLTEALRLYNPMGAAEKVVHFTAFPGDVRYAPMFDARRIEVFPFFSSADAGILAASLGVPAALARVVRKIRRERLNMIRGRLPYFGSLIGCLAGRLLRVPTVVSLGGNNRLPQQREGHYYFGNRWLSYGMERTVLRLATAIVVPNRFTFEYVVGVVGEGRVREKIAVIPWIVEPAETSGAAVDFGTLRLASDRPIVLVIGHLNRYKYSLEMYDVATHLLRRQPGRAQFVFCGDGPLRQEGESRLREFADVHFVGWQSHQTVLALMRAAAAVLVPMSGFVLLEAAALAKPVVAGAVEWHGEIVADDETGWLLNPEATDAWADRIIWILDNPDRANAVGRRLGELFQREYSPDVSLRRETDLYNRLIAT